MEPIITSIAAIASQSLIKKTIDETIEYISKKYNFTNLNHVKEKYIDYCSKQLFIKTLANKERSIFIDDIYVPLRLNGINTLSLLIEEDTCLDHSEKAILIKGLAGQGKSTLLRKLMANNAKYHKRLPIFYELKNYKGGSIESALVTHFNNVGIKIKMPAIESILSDSQVKVFLDAFDESNPDYRGELLDEISKLINKSGCYIVITTRPDTEIDSLTNIETYLVDTLSQDQIFNIIHKTCDDEEKSKELCKALERSPLHKSSESILKSPILVVLYCISYNLGEQIPNTLSQFYANIFDTIFFRHDNLKGKVNRIRHWNDNRRIYRELFDCLCFISQRDGASNFNLDKFSIYLGHSLKYMNEDEKLADKILKELTSITNLIIQDGYNEYRFVHKSIQEFFSASFVILLNHDKKMKFYKRCIDDSDFYTLFNNTLFFLEEIDYYDYCEHYFIPSVSNLLSLEAKELTDSYYPDSSLVECFLNNMEMRVNYRIEYNRKRKVYEDVFEIYPLRFNSKDKWPEIYQRLFNFSQQFLSFNFSNINIVKTIAENGHKIDENIFNLKLADFFRLKQISTKKAEEALLNGIGVLFQKPYNVAVKKLQNRVRAIQNNEYFDF